MLLTVVVTLVKLELNLNLKYSKAPERLRWLIAFLKICIRMLKLALSPPEAMLTFSLSFHRYHMLFR